MIQDERGISIGILAQAQVHGCEMTCRKFLVGPCEDNALVLYDVEEVARVVLVAKRESPAFVGLDQGVLSSEFHVGILIEQGVKDFRRRGGYVDHLVDVLRPKLHDERCSS